MEREREGGGGCHRVGERGVGQVGGGGKEGHQVTDSDISFRHYLTPIFGRSVSWRTKRHQIAAKLGSRLSNFPPTLTRGARESGGGGRRRPERKPKEGWQRLRQTETKGRQTDRRTDRRTLT